MSITQHFRRKNEDDEDARLTAIFQDNLVIPYQNVSILDFTRAKDDEGGGDIWSYKTCKASSSEIVTTNIPPPKHFYRPDVLVTQPTVKAGRILQCTVFMLLGVKRGEVKLKHGSQASQTSITYQYKTGFLSDARLGSDRLSHGFLYSCHIIITFIIIYVGMEAELVDWCTM